MQFNLPNRDFASIYKNKIQRTYPFYILRYTEKLKIKYF